ncbi:MAG: cobalamin B12-binding domain-containing protein [Deltaproteobacteria bacterium]|nr:cobalamin B12-binding domain-containing protein [Deltaproteobacteria bacterium]
MKAGPREGRKSRVLLVYPYDPTDLRFGPPKMGLGLAYIASVLRQEGCEVRILDKWAEFRLNGFDRAGVESLLESTLASFAPDVVGFSSYSALIADVIKDARLVERRRPGALVVIGGPHATALPAETLRRYPFIDIAVSGEGEHAMRELALGKPLEQIAGIAFAKDGEIVRTAPARPLRDLDELPAPARDLMRMDYYTQPSRDLPSRGGGLRYATILSSRGCFAACSFCMQLELRRRLGLRSPGRVVDEMEQVLDAYPQVTAFELVDSLFLADPASCEELCREIIRAGLHRRVRWKAQTRVSRGSEALYRLMHEAGCFMVGFGFESGSQRVLDAMRKRLTVAEIRTTAEAARRAGLEIDAYFIYGHPEETEEDFLKTLELLDGLQPDFAGYGRYFLVPGTEDCDRLLAQGRLPYRYDDPAVDWERADIASSRSKHNFSRIPDARFRRLERLAYRAVVLPINVRYHLRSQGPGALLDPRFAVTASRTWLASRPPWLRIERAARPLVRALDAGRLGRAHAGRLARAALGALSAELSTSARIRSSALALNATLRRAAAIVPFHAERAPATGGGRAWSLAEWPLSRPDDVRGRPAEELVARGTLLPTCRTEETSGSTSAPFRVYLDLQDQADSDLLWHRSYFQMGLLPTHRLVHLRDPDPAAESLQLRWLRSLLGLPQTTFIPISQEVDAILADLRRARPEILLALPHALARIARRLHERGEALQGLRRIFAPGAPLFADVATRIRERLGVAPQQAYGTAELGFVAWGCRAGSYHLNSDHVHVERLGDGADGRANVAMTTLKRRAMPFIRYVPGDVVLPPAGRCACGSSWPLLGRLLGRESSFLRPPGSRQPVSEHALAAALAPLGGSDRFQAIQRAPSHVELLAEETIEGGAGALPRARDAVQGLLGPEIEVTGHLVSPFQVGGIGKRPLVIGLANRRASRSAVESSAS